MSHSQPSDSSRPSWVPHEYQRRAMKLLLTQGAGGLFLDPGLGKTSICLATFSILKSKEFAQKMLIVAPLRVIYKVWPDEIKKWADFANLTVAILHGDVKEWNLDSDADVYLINPEGLLWLLDPAKKRPLPKWDILCVDESTKFKDTTTRRFRLLKPFLNSFKRRWILTGTPMPNGLEGLFGQMYILDQGAALGRYISHFRAQYFERGYNVYDWKPRKGAHEEVIEKIAPYVIRLSAEDWLKMPDLVYTTVRVTLPEAVRKTYQEVEDDFITALAEDHLVAANAAVAGVKCRQIANGAVYDAQRVAHPLHDAKLEALEDLLEELDGAPTLLLYEFEHDRDRILGRIGKVPVLGAGISTTALGRIIDDFNAGKVRILLGHPASMGHGLNLQGACHHVIWFGITWNLEHYDQTIARVYRQGQKADKVFVYHIVAEDTIDERIVKTLEVKDRNQQDLLRALSRHPTSQ